MKTKSKPRHLNLTAAQARHLHETGSLLVVQACDPQPFMVLSEEQWHSRAMSGVDPYGCRPIGSAVLEELIERAPLGKPGDVVLCREPCRYSVEHDNYYYDADNKGVGTLVYIKLSGKREKLIPARDMPKESIRLRPAIATVECRRVDSITDAESKSATFSGWADFAQWWDRKSNRRRGPEYAFDRAWGFFYTLTIEKGTKQ